MLLHVRNPLRFLPAILPSAALAFGVGQAAQPPGAPAPLPLHPSPAPPAAQSVPSGAQPTQLPGTEALADRCAAAAAYSQTHGGLSMLVMVDGRVVFERYAPGTVVQEAHALASGTKSFCGVLLAAAVADGLISSLDEPVAQTISEWRSDPRKSRITLRQLLSLTGGIEPGGIGRPPSYAQAIGVGTFAEPGAAFRYGPAPFQVFGEVLRRKLAQSGESVRGYLERRILRPLGMEVGRWTTDVDGNINLPSGAWLAAREWATFGEMLRNDGRVRSGEEWTQVVPAELLAELRRGSAANPGYGVGFWLLSGAGGMDPEDGLRGAPSGGVQGDDRATPRMRLRERLGLRRGEVPAQTAEPGQVDEAGGEPAAEAAPPVPAASDTSWASGAFMAAGLGKQRLYILPEARMVVVRQGRLERGSDFKDAEFLQLLMGDPAAAPRR